MKKVELTVRQIALIGGTRVMAGAGLGLLLADKLDACRRKTLGWTLFLIGGLSTIPLAITVLSKRR